MKLITTEREGLLFRGWIAPAQAPPIVALHGFTGHADAWDECARLAAESGQGTLWAPALPGHDERSPVLEGEGLAQAVERVARALASLHPGRWRLMGYSMGARVGLGLLVERRELFREALLVGVHPGLDAGLRPARLAEEASWRRILTEEGLEAFLSRWENSPLFASQSRLSPDRRARQSRLRRRHDAAGLAAAIECLGLGGMPDYRPRLGELELPIRLVVGEDDAKFLDLARAMEAELPRGRLVTVPEAGHNVVLERPEALVRILEEAR